MTNYQKCIFLPKLFLMRKLLAVLCLSLFFLRSDAQILDMLKGRVKDKAVETATSLAGNKVNNLITTQAITTNFGDCDVRNIKDPGFGADEQYTDLCHAEFSENGFVLRPGYYELRVKSFCLQAGTYAPGKGDGYLYAPLKGPKKDIVDKIVKNWYKKQNISQADVQMLLWAIISKANFKNISPELKLVAAQLLSPKEILSLSNMGLDFVPDNVMSEVKMNLPKPVQLVLEAENKMRQFFNSASYNYNELERFAMLAGVNTQRSTINYGTWGLHPGGFWIAYLPSGYSQMKVRIFVPADKGTVNYIPSNDVAVPANESSQRLLLSDVKNCN